MLKASTALSRHRPTDDLYRLLLRRSASCRLMWIRQSY